MNEPVYAVVVTRNRKALLRECLAAVGRQSRPVDRIVVIDNASTDGTAEMVSGAFAHVELVRLEENAGGAGGFHEGLRRAHEAGARWIWLMDDDTIPEQDALEQLLGAAEPDGLPRPLLLASKAVWTDGSLHPMNTPGTDRRSVDRMARAASLQLVPLRSATFVSLLVSREAIDRYGLPHAHYFLWSDDIEYTARVTRRDPAYLVPRSVVQHATETAYTSVTSTGGRFYFHVRNTLLMLRSRSWALDEKLALVHSLVTTTVAYLRANRFDAESRGVVLAGLRDGVKPVARISPEGPPPPRAAA
jgi:rhamnopyranosyl-N-acetylglucosaminyl-diphospho-decaprenol beta-1,3/1,4-galactofuranosyltransferase